MKIYLQLAVTIILFAGCEATKQVNRTEVEILEKHVEETVEVHSGVILRLEGAWQVETINSVLTDTDNRLKLNFDMGRMLIYGYDSCNTFRGKIKGLSEGEIGFDAVINTRRMCKDMSVSKAFYKALNQVKTYECEGDQLYFFNENGKRLMALKKSGQL
jgi:heat shock protein HslJ